MAILTYSDMMNKNSFIIICIIAVLIFTLLYLPIKYMDKLAYDFNINSPRIEDIY